MSSTSRRNRARPPRRPSGRGRPPRERRKERSAFRGYALVGGVLFVLFVLLVWGAQQILRSDIAPSPNVSLVEVTATAVPPPLPTATPTLAPEQIPLPVVSADVANRQVLATIERWTSTQQLGIDCVSALCNQEVSLSLTLLTSEVLEDLVQQEQAGRTVTLGEFDQRLDEMGQRLSVGEQLPFMLVVSTPQEASLPVRSQIFIGPIQSRLTLQASERQRFLPSVVNTPFDVPFESFLEKPLKGYVFFPDRNDSGQPLVSDSTSLLTLELTVNSELNSDRTVVSWNFDFIAPNRPPPTTPTPTPDPNAPPTPTPESLVDREVILSVMELLVELARESR